MIINDLQYIESATETEVQGAGGYGGYGGYGHYGHYGYYSYEPKRAVANSSGNATAYGRNTETYSNLYATADSDFGFSQSGGSVGASARS